ncbi:PCNA-associated factor-like [Lytechinus variegatus]|uniref:PCNA-associated factor-like n=1 Tax=Lytechinus variegatus TaxID=7654 RepID=UPI001BB1956E|nr:PCNA-associated factor-like [Lytechinus variegatus]
MVRTKADNSCRKAVAAKAPRKALAPTRAGTVMSPSAGGKKDKYGGGNPVNPQPTPEWQKSINTFFTMTSPSSSSSGKENKDPEDAPCSSKDVDRTEEEAGGSSSSQEQTPEKMEQEEEGDEESEEEEEEKPAPSRSFKKNRCISDSEDDDE